MDGGNTVEHTVAIVDTAGYQRMDQFLRAVDRQRTSVSGLCARNIYHHSSAIFNNQQNNNCTGAINGPGFDKYPVELQEIL